MNLNDQRLGAYKKILKGPTEDTPQEKSPSRPTAKSAAQPAPKSAAQPAAKSTAQQAQKSAAQQAARPVIDLPGLVKVPSATSGAKESPYRKVAKFLLLIGVEEAAKVMAKLTQEQTEKVVLELASIRRVDKDEAALVLAEFESLLKQAKEPEGGVGTARSILEAAFGSERAEQMLRKAVPDLDGKPFDYLDDLDPDRIYRLITDELPAVKALVLSQMKPKKAADVIFRMKEDEKKDTVIRLAKLKAINPDVVRRVDSAIREKVEAIGTSSDDSIDGRSALAAILKHMDGSSENAILRGLSDSDPDLGKDLRERLFTVDDIIGADDRFIQSKLRPMTEHDLAVLIAGKDDPFRNKILSNVSRTRGTIILEEEKIILPVSRQESELITASFFSTLRRAWEQGELHIAGRDEKEVWV